GSNPSGGCGNSSDDHEIRSGGDGFEGLGGQMSIVERWILMELVVVKGISFEKVVKEFSHLDVPHMRM
nr:hypothetical protein [Tanacetum cinerariifolium]